MLNANDTLPCCNVKLCVSVKFQPYLNKLKIYCQIIVRRLQPPQKKPKKKSKKKSRRGSSKEDDYAYDDDFETEEDDCNYVFPCNRWFAKDEDDKQIIRELIPYDATGTRVRKDSLAGTVLSNAVLREVFIINIV